MDVDINRGYIFTIGFDDGELAVFDISKPGKEKFTKQSASFKCK